MSSMKRREHTEPREPEEPEFEIIGATPEEILAEQIKVLSTLNEDLIKMFSEIETFGEAQAFALLATIAHRYNLLWLKQLVKENMIFRVSHRRRGRVEIVKLAIAPEREEYEESRGLKYRIKRFFGR